jgi:MFS family permease
MGDLTPAGREGTVMGAYATIGDIGSTAGPAVAFAMAEAFNLEWVYLLCAFIFLLGLGLVYRQR